MFSEFLNSANYGLVVMVVMMGSVLLSTIGVFMIDAGVTLCSYILTSRKVKKEVELAESL